MGGRPATDFDRDINCPPARVSGNWAVYSCTTLIAGDMGKISLKLQREVLPEAPGVWEDTESPAYSPVLRKPNRFQTRQKFIEAWMLSKLSDGNAYILKERDNRGGPNRGVVVAMYVLDPNRVKVKVSPSGSVYYHLQADTLAGVPEDEEVYVPASEIIHDTMECLFHPLVGIPPVYAHGLAAIQGLEIQTNSARFFQNQSRPGGVLSSDIEITDEFAAKLKDRWDANYAAGNTGKVAVLGGGLKYHPMATNAVDAQLVEQLKMSAEMVCSTFHVPAFMIGAGTIPAGQKVEDLIQIYYAQCLHKLMDAIQTLLIEGLGLDSPKEGEKYRVQFDLDDLMKMDGVSFILSIKTAIDASVMAPNEGRRKMNLKPVPGGDAPLSQQQNYSLEALSKRDAGPDPFATEKPAAPAEPAKPPVDEEARASAATAQRAAEAFSQRLANLEQKAAALPLPAPDVEKQTAAAFTKALMARFDSELLCG